MRWPRTARFSLSRRTAGLVAELHPYRSGRTESPFGLHAGRIQILGKTLECFGHSHKNPADRFIVAAALHHRATLVTTDAQLLGWGGTLACLDARK